VHRNVLFATMVASGASGAAAFQAPMGLIPARSGPALARAPTSCAGLRMQQVVDSKVTLGLAEPYVKDIKEAKQAFAFLQSKTYSPFSADQEKQLTGALDSLGSSIMKASENDGKYLAGDVVSTYVYTRVMKNGGFTEFAEKVNGRIAQLAFPCVLLQSFDGDFLDLLSSQPLTATFWTWLIILASTITHPYPSDYEAPGAQISGDPVSKFLDTLPADSKSTAEEVMGKVKTIFTEEAELTNSRAAMAAMGVWILTAYFFT